MKELHVKSLLPVRLDKYLMDQYPALGLGRLNKALRENKIKLNGKKQPLSTRVQNGDTIRLFLSDDQLESRPTPAAVFVYEDDDIIIANKPAGLTVDGGDADTLVRRVQAKLSAEGKPTHAVLCHRLDTGTSGLVLLAKNNAAEAFLTGAIKKREIEKRYLCVT
ncbi:MAG: RluA family pseudouridine synthase, partial [Subdoligranulum sp.]|nr:RluA family pseudouridine synthase [Subdoligranulum sp.]